MGVTEETVLSVNNVEGESKLDTLKTSGTVSVCEVISQKETAPEGTDTTT